MKKIVLVFLVGIYAFSFSCFAQAPLAIPYQAVARDAGGNLIVNQTVSLRFTIQDNVISPTVFYQETQTSVTNALGLFTANVGAGVPVQGAFSNIAWGSGSTGKYLKVEMDASGGASYVTMGTSQLLSVPYALYAKNSGNGLPAGTTAGSTLFWNGSTWISDQTIFNNGGNIGIGTVSPEFKLSLDNDGGIIAKGIYGSGADLTASGGGARMIWYPKKAAFRVGGLNISNGQFWDNDSIGNFSFATGLDARATGYGSFAAGTFVRASDQNAVAIGYHSSATAIFAFAIGSNANATKDQAVALTSFSTASGLGAVSMGNNTVASGDFSLASGVNSTASGANSTVIGIGSVASGNYSMALGTRASTNSKIGAFEIADFSTLTFMNSSLDNQFSARFAGGYRFFSDANTTDSVGMFFKGGNLGIGYPSPLEKLEIKGAVKIVDGTQGTGKILTSDNNGKASWQLPVGTIANGSFPGTTLHWNGTAWINDFAIYNNGINIGLGTTSPAARLQVQDSSVVFFAAGGVSATPHNPPNIGSGRMMLWYPERSAFRVGMYDMADTIGNYSFAAGYNNYVPGNSAVAMGTNCISRNVNSIAMGNADQATGYGAVAIGDNNKAFGDYSTVLGSTNQANGSYCFSSGLGNVVSGNGATTMGEYNIANGADAFTAGWYARATGDNTVALGAMVSTNNHFGSFVLGDGSTIGSALELDAQLNNSFSARFAGGYNFYSDLNTTEQNGLFLKSGKVGIGVATLTDKLTVSNINNFTNTIRADNNTISNGTDWGFSANYSAVHGDGAAGTTQFQAGVYGYQKGTGANSGGVVGAYSPSAWGGLGYTDAAGTHWGIYTASTLYAANATLPVANITTATMTNATIGTITNSQLSSSKIGSNGTTLTAVIRSTEVSTSAVVTANTNAVQTYAIPNVATGSSVMVSPASALTAGIVIAYARVSSAGNVEVTYRNTTASSVTLNVVNLFITVVQ